MKVWVIMTGETLPLGNARPHRAGVLARRLAEQGHEVTWWASTFDHQEKTYIPLDQAGILDLCPGCRIHLIHSPIPYQRNVSFARIRNHRSVAREFLLAAGQANRPDVIFCCFPTIDLSAAAVEFGRAKGIPVIIDVRDLWPDIFVTPFPTLLRPLARLLMTPLRLQTQRVFARCSAITAISAHYLAWARAYGGSDCPARGGVFPLSYERRPVPSAAGDLTSDECLRQLGVPPDRTIIWFVGTFGRTYDLGVPIEAARQLSEQHPNLLLVFSGEGEQGLAWRRQAQGLPNVRFTGWVDQAALQALSGAAHLGLMAYAPGAPQGLPNKVFEFMSAGVPILSSLEGETEALLKIHRIGHSYRAGDAADFLRVVNAVLADPKELRAMAQRSRHTFERHFAPDHVYSGLVQFIEETGTEAGHILDMEAK